MPQSQYLSTDPQAGMASAPPPAAPPPTPPTPTYLSTDPAAGLAGGRGAGPGQPAPSTSGRGGGPGNTRIAAATPPPRAPFYPGGGKAALQDFAGMVGGGLAAAAVAPVAAAAGLTATGVAGVTTVGRMLPWGVRAARGAAGVTGAGVGGATAAAATGAPLDVQNPGQPDAQEDSVVAAFKRQAEMEAIGLGAGWTLSAIGRRAIAGPVSRAARSGLEWLRSTEMTSVRDAFERAQDALRSHAATGAARTQARTQTTAALGRDADLVKAQREYFGEEATRARTEARGAAGAVTAAKEGLPGQIEGIRERGATAEGAARARWPQSEAAVAPPMRPVPAHGERAVYSHTTGGAGAADGMGGVAVPKYRVTDPAHPAFGSDLDAAGLTAAGIPVPAHTPPPGPINYPARALGKAAEVIGGPVMSHKRQLGEAVESAAESGPAIPKADLQARLAELSDQQTPSVMQDQGNVLRTSAGDPLPVQQALAILERNPDVAEALAAIPPELHLPAALSYANKVLTKDGLDTISFADAHKLKRLMDDVVNWDRQAKKLRESATKGFRQTLRESMSVHEPYNQATAAYRDISHALSNKQLAGRLQQAAKNNPDALVSTLAIKPNEPVRFALFKEVLTTRAAAGGGAEAGQEAWQAVQATVMYKHLIAPGIDNFEKSVAKMHPEFLHTLTGDPYARQVFDRLQTMADAVKSIRTQTAHELRGARGTTAATIAGHKATGQAARARQWKAEGAQATLAQTEETARAAKREVTRQGALEDAQHSVEGVGLQTARQSAGRAVQTASRPTAAERAFVDSKLAKQQGGAGSMLSDAVYAASAPPGSPRQMAGAARVWLGGPKVNDLIQWASFSSSRTQMFVRAVTGPAPGPAIAAMLRLYDWETGETAPKPAVSHQQSPGAKAATPPPGPRR